MNAVKLMIKAAQKPIDIYKYQGGKIEKRTEYYVLLMRKKEQQLAQKLHKTKFSGAHHDAIEGVSD